MAVARIEFIVTSSIGLWTKSVDSITETVEYRLAKHIDSGDGETHSSEILSIAKTTSISEVDELVEDLHELWNSNRCE